MGERFKEVLDDATKAVAQWPDWKKSEALKQSELTNQLSQKATGGALDEDELNKSAKSSTAGS